MAHKEEGKTRDWQCSASNPGHFFMMVSWFCESRWRRSDVWTIAISRRDCGREPSSASAPQWATVRQSSLVTSLRLFNEFSFIAAVVLLEYYSMEFKCCKILSKITLFTYNLLLCWHIGRKLYLYLSRYKSRLSSIGGACSSYFRKFRN